MRDEEINYQAFLQKLSSALKFITCRNHNRLGAQPASYTPSVELSAPCEPGIMFPLSLAPRNADTLVEALLSEIQRLKDSGRPQALTKHGSVYFQNLGLRNLEAISQFAHTF